jgi:invasion protein IalB
MTRTGHIISRFPAAVGLAALLALMNPLDATAQQKEEGARPLSGPLPVTPFGPRVRPPAGMPAMRGAPARPQPKLPQPEKVAEHGIWKVMCEKTPVPEGKGKKAGAPKKTCYVTATVADPKKKGVFLSLFIIKVKGKGPDGKPRTAHMINMRAPVGVYIPTGIGLEIDGKAVARAPFLRCNPVFCESLAEARKETISRLKKGKKARFIYYAGPGVGLPLTFDLKGFSAAMKKLDSLQP